MHGAMTRPSSGVATVRYRPVIFAGLLIAGALISPAAQSVAQSPSVPAVQKPPPPPVAASIPVAKPKPVPPMNPLPRTAKAADFQKALTKYAQQSGQMYAVDSSAFDP